MDTYPALAKKARALGFTIELQGNWIVLEAPAGKDAPYSDFRHNDAGLLHLYQTLQKYEQMLKAEETLKNRKKK